MKKTLLFVALCVLACLSSKAQDESESQNVVKINPLGAIFGAAQLSYERALSEKSSVQISPSFGFFSSGGLKYTTYGIGASYRFYFSNSKSAPAGFYAGPGVGYQLGKVKFSDDFGGGSSSTAKIGGFNANFVAGYQWIFDSGFTLDLNGGIQYIKYKYTDNEDGSFSAPFSGILPTLGFGIGYSF